MQHQTTSTLRCLILVGACLTQSAVGLAELPKIVPTADPISARCMKPMKGDFATPEQAGLKAEVVTFKNTSGNNLRAWFFPVKDAKQSILFCMGNTGNISLMLPYAKILQEAGYDVLLFDYQGFGESEGPPAVLTLLDDGLAAFDFLQAHTKRPAKDIGVFGVSLGSVLALTIAAERKAGAVAVEDAFLPDVMLDRYSQQIAKDSMIARIALHSIKSLLLAQVDPLKNVARLECPVFFLHGLDDWLLPYSGTLQISKKATTPKRVWLMPNTGHAPESLETNDREYRAQLSSFFHDAFANDVNEIRLKCSWFVVNEDPNLPRERPGERPGEVVITTPNSDHPQPTLLVMADYRGRQQNVHPNLTRQKIVPQWINGNATIPMSIILPPMGIAAVRYHHVTKEGDSWKPELSEFSQALADYHKHASQILGGNSRADTLTQSNGYGFTENARLIPEFPTTAAIGLLKKRTAIKNAPPRIQARYARLFARLHCWPKYLLGDSPPKDLSIFGENMLDFLPADPDAYYELQNAGMQLGFRDTMVGDSLFRLAKKRLTNGRQEAARGLLRKHVSILPPQAPTNLTEKRIQSINTLEDLIGPSK